jgi:hypothetical protein
MAAADFCNDHACATADRRLFLQLSEDFIRSAVAQSSHISVDYHELLAALLVASYTISGYEFTLDNLMDVLEMATEANRAGRERQSFEAEAMAGIDGIPVADVPPRVLISKADVEAISQRVAELLRVSPDGR